ncbi:MAG: ABC transporter substrate-binding protein [Dehalococcoidia bacterium]
MKPLTGSVILLLSMVSLLVVMLPACSSDDGSPAEPAETTKPAETTAPAEEVVLTIGNITDQSGGGAAVLSIVDDAVGDVIKYYNENNLIPGVRVKMVSYDSAYDPAKEVPAYNYLKSKGADIIIGNMPNSAVVLRPFINADEIPFFSQSYTEEGFYPPAYLFSINVRTDRAVRALLEWISENDPDFPEDRPARIGGVNWDEPLSRTIFNSCKKYAQEHPDKFEWEGHYLTGRVFTWDVQAEGLKDCDYLMPPMAGLSTFAKEYRDSGYTGKFFGTDGHAAFMGLIEDARLWDELNGMYFILPVGYWTDDTELVNLAKDFIEARPDTQTYYDYGTSYLGPFISYYGMLAIIAEAASEVGAENLNSETLYQTAQNFSTDLNGHEFGFSPASRNSFHSFGIYELRAEDKNLFRVVPEWISVAEPE